MNAENKKLLNLMLQTLEDGKLEKTDRAMFMRDHKKYLNDELTFRELLESIRHPAGDLKTEMKRYYTATIYNRVFK